MLINRINKIFKENNFDFFKIKSTTSTMDEAKKKINLSKKNFVILAEKQTHGKGRRGNKWSSPIGNIYCSIAILSNILLKEYSKFSMLSSVAIKDSLKHIGINNIFFKWPNDIFIKNAKISGVIQEIITNKFNKKYLIIGIGINFDSSPNISKYKTTHICQHINNIDKEQYFEIFINYFLFYFNKFISSNNIAFIDQYRKSQLFINNNIQIKIAEKNILTGILKGINDDGSLILQQKNKKISIYSGEIIL